MFGAVLFLLIMVYVLLRVYLKHGRLFAPVFSDKAILYAREHDLTEDELVSIIRTNPGTFGLLPPPPTPWRKNAE
jgi:hypothetical protein